MKKHYIIIVILLIGLSSNVTGQTFTEDKKHNIAKTVAQKIKQYYPDPEISSKVANGIYEELKGDYFQNVRTHAEFAGRMTDLIEGLSNDKHLDLLYNPELAKIMISGDDNGLMAEKEAEIERWNNYGFNNLAILDGNIGYMNLSVFFDLTYAHLTAEHAMGYFANCNGLIIDLRQNGGGWDEMVTFLLSYFVEPPGPGTLRVLQSTLDSSYTTSYVPPAVVGDRLSDIPVFILISRATASAAEAFATNMKYLNNNVTLIGERTRGAENPVDYVAIDENFILQTPSYRIIFSLNPYRWEGKGIDPDIAIDNVDAKAYAHLLMLNDLYKACSDSVSCFRYRWALDGLEASYKNADSASLTELTGTYGKYEVFLKDNNIFLQFNNHSPRKLIPVTQTYFVVEGVDHYRISFINDHFGQRMRRMFSYGDMQEISKEEQN